jgi:hypothetical protein
MMEATSVQFQQLRTTWIDSKSTYRRKEGEAAANMTAEQITVALADELANTLLDA